MNENKQPKIRVVGAMERKAANKAARHKIARAAILIAGRQLREEAAQRPAREDRSEGEA